MAVTKFSGNKGNRMSKLQITISKYSNNIKNLTWSSTAKVVSRFYLFFVFFKIFFSIVRCNRLHSVTVIAQVNLMIRCSNCKLIVNIVKTKTTVTVTYIGTYLTCDM